MNCQKFNEIADSYLADELLVETNHEVLRHLENCAECREELGAQRDLRGRVRSAVKNSPEMLIDSTFRSRLQTNLRAAAFRPTFWERIRRAEFFDFKSLALAAACLLIAAAFGGLWLNRSKTGVIVAANNQTNLPSNAQTTVETPLPQAAFAAWQETSEKAVGDHKNCAVKFRLAEHPITLDQAAEKYGKFNKNLDQVVLASINESKPEKPPGKIEMLEAHSCIFQGRRFAHIVLRYQKSIVFGSRFRTGISAERRPFDQQSIAGRDSRRRFSRRTSRRFYCFRFE